MRKSVIAVVLSIALVVSGCGSQVQYASVDLTSETVAYMPMETHAPEFRSWTRSCGDGVLWMIIGSLFVVGLIHELAA
ncbi:MAG: hypothetical protein ACYTKD_06140 [Planctomycetota bacterium]|jgi:hypothetical protein